METFSSYLKERNIVKHDLKQLYTQPSFRRRQYRTYLGKRSSEDKFTNKIAKTFTPPEKGGRKKIVIMWGNWGKNPNLKHQPPTPGIGLRRKVHRTFQTYTCYEGGTSSSCPLCRKSLEYPLTKKQKVYDEVKDEKVYMLENIHHVLRCTNENCGIWWDRDILGSCNIGLQSEHCLGKGCLDDHFSATTKPKKTVKKNSTSLQGAKRVSPISKDETSPQMSRS